MKRNIFLFMFLAFFTFVISANEKIGHEIEKEHIASFSKVFNQNGIANIGLVEKMNKSSSSSDNYSKASIAMFYVFLAGCITIVVGIPILVAGALVYVNGALLADSGNTVGWALLGSGIGVSGLSLIMIIVGVVLWKVFEKKAETASLFMESNRVGVASLMDNSPNSQKNFAVGLKFSF